MDDDDVDLIDQDELLDEEDMAKPDQATLRVCGTTGKRKACKDCSCGLAEEITNGGEITTKSVNSSCGSVSILQIQLRCHVHFALLWEFLPQNESFFVT